MEKSKNINIKLKNDRDLIDRWVRNSEKVNYLVELWKKSLDKKPTLVYTL